MSASVFGLLVFSKFAWAFFRPISALLSASCRSVASSSPSTSPCFTLSPTFTLIALTVPLWPKARLAVWCDWILPAELTDDDSVRRDTGTVVVAAAALACAGRSFVYAAKATPPITMTAPRT